MQMEAELDGVECLGYVSSEVMNEHPSELPDFDRRMWAVDPFYGWRTQERDIHETMSMAKPMDHTTVSTLSPQPPSKDPGDDFRDPSKDLPLQPDQTWMNWFMGSPQPAEEPPRAQKSMLPHAKHLLRKEESDDFVPRPSPSAAALRPILEPEMLAAGMAWNDLDQRLWEELHSVGELRRAAAKPQEFPGSFLHISAGVLPFRCHLRHFFRRDRRNQPSRDKKRWTHKLSRKFSKAMDRGGCILQLPWLRKLMQLGHLKLCKKNQ